MLAIWNSCKGSYSRLTGEDLENTFQYICNTLNSIRQEAALLCRQPEATTEVPPDERCMTLPWTATARRWSRRMVIIS